MLILLVASALLPVQAQDENVEITFVHIFPNPDDVRGQTLTALIEEFESQNPGVTVNVVSNTDSYGELFDAALLAASQGNAPHVVQVEDTLTQLAIDSTFFVPISDYASAEQLEAANFDDFLPPINNYYGLSTDVIWGIPWNSSNPVLYYNNDMLTAAGVEAPPTTFDEMLAACEAIMNAGIEGLDACINWPVTSWFPEQWLAMQGVLFANNDNGRSGRVTEVNWDTPELLNIMNWWQTMADEGYYSTTGTTEDYFGEFVAFVSQNTAMHISSTAAVSNAINFSRNQFELGVAPLVRPSADATNGVTAGGAALWVTGGHSDAETQAAVDFVLFMTNPESIALWHQGSGYLPNRQSSIDMLEAENWFEENPFFAVAVDQLLAVEESNPANAGAVMGPYGTVRDIHNEVVLSIISGDASPEEALEAGAQRANSTIQEYNSIIGG
jgi:sn-glycerol 3-phosphate transport system substrate-binding protein